MRILGGLENSAGLEVQWKTQAPEGPACCLSGGRRRSGCASRNFTPLQSASLGWLSAPSTPIEVNQQPGALRDFEQVLVNGCWRRQVLTCEPNPSPTTGRETFLGVSDFDQTWVALLNLIKAAATTWVDKEGCAFAGPSTCSCEPVGTDVLRVVPNCFGTIWFRDLQQLASLPDQLCWIFLALSTLR